MRLFDEIRRLETARSPLLAAAAKDEQRKLAARGHVGISGLYFRKLMPPATTTFLWSRARQTPPQKEREEEEPALRNDNTDADYHGKTKMPMEKCRPTAA